MDSIKWDQFKDASLKFVWDEANKTLTESFTSFRENINKSFLAVSFYVSVLSYSLKQLIDEGIIFNTLPYLTLVLGMSAAIWVIWRNLFPEQMAVSGTKPEMLLHEYYVQDGIKENQEREMIIQRLKDIDKSINENLSAITNRAERFRLSAFIFASSLFLCLAVTALV